MAKGLTRNLIRFGRHKLGNLSLPLPARPRHLRVISAFFGVVSGVGEWEPAVETPEVWMTLRHSDIVSGSHRFGAKDFNVARGCLGGPPGCSGGTSDSR